MARTYTYQQRCPIARSLDIVGDRWTMLVLRDLGRGHTRYVDLMRELRGISPNVLSERLKHLEQEGLISSALYSQHPPRAEYRLTEKGEAFKPVLRALIAWGDTYAPRPPRSRAKRAAEDLEDVEAPAR
ncbi:MAG: helix-turn-helix transcriptional regulator [Dehalococcoidia bacterium]|nr:helix-turn-helix transcriptional regulator [Dehalococcoidia bacterium]